MQYFYFANNILAILVVLLKIIMAKSDGEYEKELYIVLRDSNTQFDKNVLFISSGAFAISFAFIEKIIPNLKNAINKDNLFASWYILGCVIFISLLSHFVSILSIRWTIINHQNQNIFDKGRKKWNIFIRLLNISMIVGLLIGNILLINFIKQNL